MKSLIEDSTVFARILSLWQKVFGDEEKTIRAFYRSFDNAGNIFYALNGKDGVRITSDLYEDDGDVAGLVNRVPLKLSLHNKTYEGYYIYAGCVDPVYRGKGIYRDIMREAERGTLFTVLIPATDSLFGMYRKLGYTETSGTPFPFEANKTKIRSIKTEPFDGDAGLLYRLYRTAEGDRFIKDKPFFLFAASDFAAEGRIFYIKDANGSRCGYIIYSENKNTIKIYDICCSPYKNSDIIESNIFSDVKSKNKSMIRGMNEAPGLNMFGEY